MSRNIKWKGTFCFSGQQIRTIRLKSYYIEIDTVVRNIVLPTISKAFRNVILTGFLNQFFYFENNPCMMNLELFNADQSISGTEIAIITYI